jgi:hypothetical protein
MVSEQLTSRVVDLVQWAENDTFLRQETHEPFEFVGALVGIAAARTGFAGMLVPGLETPLTFTVSKGTGGRAHLGSGDFGVFTGFTMTVRGAVTAC